MTLVSSAAAASRKLIILVLTGGGPLDVSFAEGDPNVASILWVGYPGEAGGEALAEVIYGDFNPGGRLPMTWHPESFTKADPFRGYPGRKRVYGFGQGLSYTKLLYAPRKLSLSRSFTGSSSENILHQRQEHHISIANVGDMDGSHVVMLFSRAPKCFEGTPEKQAF